MLTQEDYQNLARLLERDATTFNGIAQAMYAVRLYDKLLTLANPPLDQEADGNSSDSH